MVRKGYMPSTKRETFYQILGLPRDSQSKTIEEVYLKEVEFWEGIASAGSPEAKEKIIELTRAFLTLSNPEKRAKYDSELDFDFVLLDGKAKDPEIEEAYDLYRLSHKKSYQEILGEFTRFREEMGDTLWILKKTTIYLVLNLILYSGIVVFQSFAHESTDSIPKDQDTNFDVVSVCFLTLSFICFLYFRFQYLPKQIKERKKDRS
ncbi:J domain-containing protein [Leptospira sp. WS60.C2]